MMARSLNVWINQALVGVLTEQNNLWSFTYSSLWLAHDSAYPLCPGLPLQAEPHVDGASIRPVQWYFDNLLPEEGQRALIAEAAKISQADAFGLLEHYGAESAGSLTLLAPGHTPAPGDYQPLPDPVLAERIRKMPKVALAAQAQKRMSLAGAQHKVAVTLDGSILLEPTGNAPSTHILKPDHPEQRFAHSVINEYAIMSLARRVGLTVPNVQRRYVPQPIYLVERFDRRRTPQDTLRLHAIDACQMLNIDRVFKYSAGSVPVLRDLAEACTLPAVAKAALFNWLVFNVITGNTDAHLKNLSLMATPQGYQLAPFYDLLCTAIYQTRMFDKPDWPDDVAMAWPIVGVSRLSDIETDTLIEAGGQLGITATTSRNLLARMIKAVQRHTPLLFQQLHEESQAMSRERPELRATLAGEARLLRGIEHTVIRETLERLAGNGG